jgi:hypothetical protein
LASKNCFCTLTLILILIGSNSVPIINS